MGMNPFTGLVEISKEGVSKGVPFEVVDDDVAVIALPKITGMVLITETEGHGQIMAYVNTDTPSIVSFAAQGGVYTLTTGILTGITGVDTEQTISVSVLGNLYIENRSGVARNYVVSVLNQGDVL